MTAPLPPLIDYRDWYCLVGEDATRVWSSKTNTYVPADDPEFVAKMAAGVPGGAGTEAELWDMMQARDSTVLPAWLFNGEVFIQTAVDVYNPDQLAAYSADKRWRKEQGGITTTAGFPIKTDDRAQAKITGVYAASKESPGVVTPWHAADGTVVQLDASGMYAMNTDLLTHINNCFSVSKDVLDGIAAGTVTTPEGIDAMYDAPMTQARKDWLKR